MLFTVTVLAEGEALESKVAPTEVEEAAGDPLELAVACPFFMLIKEGSGWGIFLLLDLRPKKLPIPCDSLSLTALAEGLRTIGGG